MAEEGKSNDDANKRDILRNWGKNVASISDGAYVTKSDAVKGEGTDGCGGHNNMLREDWTHYGHCFGNTFFKIPNFVEINFKMAYEINTIRLLLWDGDNRHYGYYIQVSLDGNNWKKIVDYSNGNRKSWQTIRFDKSNMRCVRIFGTANSANDWFHIVKFMAYFDYSLK